MKMEDDFSQVLAEQFPDIASEALAAIVSAATHGESGDSVSPPHLTYLSAMLRAVAGGDAGAGAFTFKPGETFLTMPGVGQVSTAMPIPHNVWYLVLWENLFNIENPGVETSLAWEELQATLARECGGVDCLRQHPDWQSAMHGNGARSIKAMRFESWTPDAAPQFPSMGPRHAGDLWTKYGGYLAFPIGPLGVMEFLSVVSLQLLQLQGGGFPGHEVHDGGDAITVRVLDGLLSPKDRVGAPPAGMVLYRLGFLQDHEDSEYLAHDFAGQQSLEYHHWLRLYLRRDLPWPRPGEFVGLLAQPLPYHVWWHQETSPFLYSGNWFDTAAYTSGRVVERIDFRLVSEVNGMPSKEEADLYKVVIHGVEVILRTTDFRRYEVGESVAIIRQESGHLKCASWLDSLDMIQYYNNTPKHLPSTSVTVFEGLLIAPIQFYQ